MIMKAIHNGDNPVKITGSMKEKLSTFQNRHLKIIEDKQKVANNDISVQDELSKLQDIEQKVIANLPDVEFIENTVSFQDQASENLSETQNSDNLSDELSDFSFETQMWSGNTDSASNKQEEQTAEIKTDNQVSNSIDETRQPEVSMSEPISENNSVVNEPKMPTTPEVDLARNELETSNSVNQAEDSKPIIQQTTQVENASEVKEPEVQEEPVSAPPLPEIPITKIEPISSNDEHPVYETEEMVTPVYDFDAPVIPSKEEIKNKLSQKTIDAINSIIDGTYKPEEDIEKGQDTLQETSDPNATNIFMQTPKEAKHNNEDITESSKDSSEPIIVEEEPIDDEEFVDVSKPRKEPNLEDIKKQVHEDVDNELPIIDTPVAVDSKEKLDEIYSEVDVKPEVPNKSKTRDLKDLTLFVDYEDYKFTFGQQHYKKEALKPAELEALGTIKGFLTEKEFNNKRTVQYNKITNANKQLNKKIVTLSKSFTKTIDKTSKEYTKTTEQLTKQANAAKDQIEIDRVEKVQTQKLNEYLTANIKDKDQQIDDLIKENNDLKKQIIDKDKQLKDLKKENASQSNKIKVFEDKLNTVLGIVNEVKINKKAED